MKTLILIIAVVFIIQIPMLARVAQNPDGAEMVLTAIQGGVLHPPGFPLQAWVNRLFILLPIDAPATRLAVLSLLASVVTTILVVLILRRLGVGITGQFAGVCFFSFYPMVWYLSVQPEKYGLTWMFIGLFLYIYFRTGDWPADRFDVRLLIGYGALLGLALSQHPVIFTMLPAMGATLYAMSRTGTRAIARLALSLGTCALVAGLFYLSLPWLRTQSAWPDWGKLESIHDIVRHVLRLDLRAAQTSEPTTAGYITAFDIFVRDYLQVMTAAALLPVVGALAIYRCRRRMDFWVIASCLCGNLGFLLTFRWSPPGHVASAYLERYAGGAILILAILTGAGVDWLRTKVQMKIRPLFDGTAMVLAVWFIAHGWHRANAATDPTLDLFRRGVGLSLDKNAIYLAGTDIEIFAGVETSQGTRFPHFAEFDWVKKRVLPHTEPRLAVRDIPVSDLIDQAVLNGVPLACSTREAFGPAPAQIQGLLWVVRPSVTAVSSQNTVDFAVRLCAILNEMKTPISRDGHHYSQQLWQSFSTAYTGAGDYLSWAKQPTNADIAYSIAAAINDGRYPNRWQSGCASLTKINGSSTQ